MSFPFRSDVYAFSVPVDLKHFPSYGFAFINFLNPDEYNFEDVPFSLPGRACQDVSVVMLLNAPVQGSTTIFCNTRTTL